MMNGVLQMQVKGYFDVEGVKSIFIFYVTDVFLKANEKGVCQDMF